MLGHPKAALHDALATGTRECQNNVEEYVVFCTDLLLLEQRTFCKQTARRESNDDIGRNELLRNNVN